MMYKILLLDNEESVSRGICFPLEKAGLNMRIYDVDKRCRKYQRRQS
ncbi:MAG: hypothetical protein K2O40_08220 [Lachnospiraceae bacterium]|nr:hypothetical protein [Lachnospiraceae bacterium]